MKTCLFPQGDEEKMRGDGDLCRAATQCWGRLTDSGVPRRRAAKDADILTARYTEGGPAPAHATARQPDNCTCRDGGTCGWWSRRLAAVGWRRSPMAAVQADSTASKTMAAGAASDAGEAFVKATCGPLELLLSAGLSTATDGGRRAIFQATGHRWPSTSSDDNLR